ncbi:MAG: metal-dependent hydrolase [Verrucomicrobia bacterium]|nr:metal-dependent hydrolase [Verrucomicrobiota bacterium]
MTHFLAGWAVANAVRLGRHDRALVTLAGVVPDADGLGIIAEIATRGSSHPLNWFSDYHHVLGHNLGFALLTALAAFALARDRCRTTALALASFHLHLLCDLLGARGPDGEQWPIPYLLPFSRAWQLTWPGQWALNAWPNFVITALLIALMFRLAWRRGYSPLEMFSPRADAVFVETLRRRWPVSR